MSNLEDRQKAYENKFMHDEELHFKATAAAIKKVARDVAGKIGQTDAYGSTIIGVLVEEGPQAALKQIANDLDKKGLANDAADVPRHFEKAHLAEMAKLKGDGK